MKLSFYTVSVEILPHSEFQRSAFSVQIDEGKIFFVLIWHGMTHMIFIYFKKHHVIVVIYIVLEKHGNTEIKTIMNSKQI